MDTKDIVSKLDGKWYKWPGEKFARAYLIARALRISIGAVNKYEITKQLRAYNNELGELKASGKNRLYKLKDIQEIKDNLNVREENSFRPKLEKV